MRPYLLIIFSFFSLLVAGQGKAHALKDNQLIEKQTLFGFQYSAIMPGNLIQKNNYQFESDSVNYSIHNSFSNSYGVEIRHYFTYRFAINTGILYTKRNISVDFRSQYPTQSRGTDTTFSRDLRFIAFEIPLKLSGYVRLSNEIYMSIAGGVNLNFYPSHIRTDNVYMQRIGSMGWMFFQLGYSGSLGWEFRTTDNGIIYLGASYQARIDHMASILFFEKETIHTADYYHNVNGNYLSIDIKYFFPINNSGTRPE